MKTVADTKELPQYLDIRGLAEWLDLPRSWIYDRTRREAIPLVRLGKHIRFPVAEINQWMESGCPDISKDGGRSR